MRPRPRSRGGHGRPGGRAVGRRRVPRSVPTSSASIRSTILPSRERARCSRWRRAALPLLMARDGAKPAAIVAVALVPVPARWPRESPPPSPPVQALAITGRPQASPHASVPIARRRSNSAGMDSVARPDLKRTAKTTAGSEARHVTRYAPPTIVRCWPAAGAQKFQWRAA